MDTSISVIAIMGVGIVATLVMDIWGILRQRLLGIAPPNYVLVGRWLGHMPQGRFHHPAIAKSAAVRGETVIGWSAHYLIGIAFAALLLALTGSNWLVHPTPGPAIAVGVITVAAPFLLMQPGMGAGIAASKTPNPTSARLHSLINHAVFGLGLYLGGLISAALQSA